MRPFPVECVDMYLRYYMGHFHNDLGEPEFAFLVKRQRVGWDRGQRVGRESPGLLSVVLKLKSRKDACRAG